VDYVLEVERTLLAATPKRWSVGSAVPGETREASFSLTNSGPTLANVTYLGMMENVETEVWTGSIGDKVIWTVPIEVPENVTRFGLGLSWDDPDSDLALLLFNQNGRPVDVSYGEGEAGEEVGASHPVPGVWRAIVYGYHVTTRSRQPFELEATFYVQETWEWVRATGPGRLDSGTSGRLNASIAVPPNASSEGLEGYIQVRSDHDRFTIPVSLTVAGASLTGTSTTDLIDEDGDGLYEELCIEVGVEVTAPGEYRVEGSLLDGNRSAIGWLGSTKLLEEDGSIEICVNGSEIWKSGGCGPLSLENLFLYSGEGDIIDRFEGNITILKCPQDFQPIPARFTGRYLDLTLSGKEPGEKPSSVIIGVEVDVQTPGRYEIAGRLVDEDGFEIDAAEVAASLEAGVQMVNITFDPIRFTMLGEPSRLHLINLTLSREGEVIERVDEAISTESRSPEEFTMAKKIYVISPPPST